MVSDDPWRRFVRHKNARLRFLRKVEIVGDCWIWRGRRRKEYGIMCLEGRMCNAHRAAYVLFVNPVHDGVSVLHSCGNKLCCCPDHLFLEVQEKFLSSGLVVENI